jgi:hypothetical protein
VEVGMNDSCFVKGFGVHRADIVIITVIY